MRKVVIIWEHFTPSTAHIGRAFWTGYFSDTLDGYDYNLKKVLIENCKKDGYEYEVVRQHRNGKRSIIEKG